MRRRRVKTECAYCKAELEVIHSQMKYFKKHFCDARCRKSYWDNISNVVIPCDECGKPFKKLKSHVRKHNYCSTECYSKARSYDYAGMIGKKYNYLTVLGMGKRNKGRYTFECKCDCGNTYTVLASYVVSGHILSCGCLKYKTKKNGVVISLQERLEGDVFTTYKRAAKERGYCFDLPYSLFTKMIHEPCFFCGEEDSNETKYNGDRSISMKYNGIDRLNNDLGYTIDNCVPSCRSCNRMKSDMSMREFLDRINAIHLRVGGMITNIKIAK